MGPRGRGGCGEGKIERGRKEGKREGGREREEDRVRLREGGTDLENKGVGAGEEEGVDAGDREGVGG